MPFTKNVKSDGNGSLGNLGIPGPDGAPGQGIFGDGVLDNYLTSPQAANVAKHFISPGDEVRDLEMRANFKDWKQARAMNEYLHLCREFDDKMGEEQLLDYMASLCGIQGERIRILAAVLSRMPTAEVPRNQDRVRRQE